MKPIPEMRKKMTKWNEQKPKLLKVNLKFIYSEKATKLCEIFTLLLTGTTLDKSKVKISQNFVAFSEYMNFNKNSIAGQMWHFLNSPTYLVFSNVNKSRKILGILNSSKKQTKHEKKLSWELLG